MTKRTDTNEELYIFPDGCGHSPLQEYIYSSRLGTPTTIDCPMCRHALPISHEHFVWCRNCGGGVYASVHQLHWSNDFSGLPKIIREFDKLVEAHEVDLYEDGWEKVVDSIIQERRNLAIIHPVQPKPNSTPSPSRLVISASCTSRLYELHIIENVLKIVENNVKGSNGDIAETIVVVRLQDIVRIEAKQEEKRLRIVIKGWENSPFLDHLSDKSIDDIVEFMCPHLSRCPKGE